MALLAVAIFVAGLPAAYREFAAPSSFDPEGYAALRANLAEVGISVGIYKAWFTVVVPVIIAAVFFSVATLIFLRRPEEPMALFVALLLVLLGATRSESNETLAALYPSLAVPSSLLESSSLVSVFLFFFVFPDGRFVPSWSRWLGLPLAGYLLVTASLPGSSLDPKNWHEVSHTLFLG